MRIRQAFFYSAHHRISTDLQHASRIPHAAATERHVHDLCFHAVFVSFVTIGLHEGDKRAVGVFATVTLSPLATGACFYDVIAATVWTNDLLITCHVVTPSISDSCHCILKQSL